MNRNMIKVLLVNNSLRDGRRIEGLLNNSKVADFDLVSVRWLSAARERLINEKADVVLLDLMLPDSRGLQTFDKIHADAPDVPIIILSGHEDEELGVAAVRNGAQDYLVKGEMDSNILARTLRYAIERKRGEEALRLSEAHLRRIIEKNADGILIVNKKGIVLFINPTAEALFGCKADLLLGKPFGFPLEAGEANEFDILQEDGSALVAEMRVVEIVWDGDFAHLASLRDITERKRLEEELKRYTEELEERVSKQVNEMVQSEKMASLGQLVAGVAHEINNPLAFIKSNTQLISKKIMKLMFQWKEEKKDIESLEHIGSLIDINIDGIGRIATITKTLKRFARSDSEGRGAANINEGIRDTLVIVHNRLKHRIKVHDDYGNVPKTICNMGQLNQVFMNLILNSSQSMDEGDIWIKTWDDKQNIYIEIKDNGGGIPTNKLNKIFDPFFTTKDEGTGFGLSISYRIIKDHNGDISVKSEVGKGTTMNITIPIEV